MFVSQDLAFIGGVKWNAYFAMAYNIGNFLCRLDMTNAKN
jgi:hypothetical protein